MNRAFIIHGWDGRPQEGWFPWLKTELEKRNFVVEIPAMPNSAEPEMNAWVAKLSEVVGDADEKTVLVGHSIGCQTIVRYLATLQDSLKIASAVLVAPWVTLIGLESEEEKQIAKPWLTTPIDWGAVRAHTSKVIAIFSDDDPFVPLSDVKVFEQELGAKIIIQKNQGHLSEEHGVMELPEVLENL